MTTTLYIAAATICIYLTIRAIILDHKANDFKVTTRTRIFATLLGTCLGATIISLPFIYIMSDAYSMPKLESSAFNKVFDKLFQV